MQQGQKFLRKTHPRKRKLKLKLILEALCYKYQQSSMQNQKCSQINSKPTKERFKTQQSNIYSILIGSTTNFHETFKPHTVSRSKVNISISSPKKIDTYWDSDEVSADPSKRIVQNQYLEDKYYHKLTQKTRTYDDCQYSHEQQIFTKLFPSKLSSSVGGQ